MTLLGPISVLPRGHVVSPQGECFQILEAFCKEGNVEDLEEPLTGWIGFPMKPYNCPTLAVVDAR